jgi:hypothetical protein
VNITDRLKVVMALIKEDTIRLMTDDDRKLILMTLDEAHAEIAYMNKVLKQREAQLLE